MEIRYNLTGTERKKLVAAISEIVGEPLNYKGAPTFAYEVGIYRIDKEGTLSGPDVMEVGEALTGYGFEGILEREYTDEEPILEHGHDGLTIEMPIEGFSDAALDNLEKLVASKAALIMKAIGAAKLPIERTEEKLRFPWFRAGLTAEAINAYSRFVSALCAAAKEQKRVTAKEKPVENEKFAFRVFLIRLGFVGDEYKQARRILLMNLTGNSAFKSGKRNPQGEDETLNSEVMADE